jgi:hypothetical protein
VTTWIDPTAETAFVRAPCEDGSLRRQLKLLGDAATYFPRIFINGVAVGQEYDYRPRGSGFYRFGRQP